MSKLGDIADATADANQAADLRHQLLTLEIRGLKRTIKVLVVAFLLIWGLSGLYYERLEPFFAPMNAMFKKANAAIVWDDPNIIEYLPKVGAKMRVIFMERAIDRNCTEILSAIKNDPNLMALEGIKEMVVGAGFEPAKAEPSDLQSDPFDRSGILPRSKGGHQTAGR